MSWSGHGSAYLKREKLNRVMERTRKLDESFPALSEFFSSSHSLEEEFASDLIQKITFSRYPGSKISGGAALRAFVTSDKNLPVLKTNGTIGALVNILLSVDVAKEGTSNHVESAIQSLHILLQCDTIAQQRLLANPHIVPLILKLCQYTIEDAQSKSFDILEWLSLIDHGLNEFIDQGLIEVLFKSELLHSARATTRVKHGAVEMIYKISNIDALKLAPNNIETVVVDAESNLRVDLYMEEYLLDSLMAHLKICDRNNFANLAQYVLLPYLIKKVLDERFVNLDDMHKAVQILAWYSKSVFHTEFLLRNDILPMLQYLIRTDFNIFRRSERKDPAALAAEIRKKLASKSMLADKRSLPTLMAVATVKPQSSTYVKTDDINFGVTMQSIHIYEHLVNAKPDVVVSIISSGFIPALLFRVGYGPDLDIRLNITAVSFLESVLLRVCLSQPRYGRKISLVGTLAKPKTYLRGPFVEQQKQVDYTTGSTKDLGLITRTVRAQGVVSLFISSMRRTEHQELIRKALLGLSYLHFPTIAADIYGPENISRICHLTKTKQDCFFAGLALVCDAILYLGDMIADVITFSYIF